MEYKAEEFKNWMDQRNLTARDVANPMHTAEQTIRQWRPFGVPPRRKAHVELFMKEWDETADAPRGEQNLVLNPNSAQFERWSQAALAKRKTLHQWAIDGLERLAEETDTEQDIALVSEKIDHYKSKKSA